MADEPTQIIDFSNTIRQLYDKIGPLVELCRGLSVFVENTTNPDSDNNDSLSSEEATQLSQMLSREISAVFNTVSNAHSELAPTEEEQPSNSPISSPARPLCDNSLIDESEELNNQIAELKLTEQKLQVQNELLASKCAVQEEEIQTLTGKLHVALDQARAWDQLSMSTTKSPRGSLRAAYAVLERTHEETGILEQRHKEEVAALLSDADRKITAITQASNKREDALVEEIQRLDEKVRGLEEKIAKLREEKMETKKDLSAERRKRDAIIKEKENEYKTVIKTLERANNELALENERILIGRGSRLLHTYKSPRGSPSTPRR
ncbi:hypothetical protein P9112_013071 [Eukaryota sp. TZLM1-RC]